MLFRSEVAAVNASTENEALKLIEQQLAKSPKRSKAAEVEAETESDPDLDQEEAA